jgi:hypothetical protein
MELLIIVIVALALLAISKGGIEIKITHTHIHKSDEIVDKLPKEGEYNSSYGDPDTMRYLDKVYDGGNK